MLPKYALHISKFQKSPQPLPKLQRRIQLFSCVTSTNTNPSPSGVSAGLLGIPPPPPPRSCQKHILLNMLILVGMYNITGTTGLSLSPKTSQPILINLSRT